MFTFLDPYRSTIPSNSEMLATTYVKPSTNEQLCPLLQTMDREEKTLLETASEIQIDSERDKIQAVIIVNSVASIVVSSVGLWYTFFVDSGSTGKLDKLIGTEFALCLTTGTGLFIQRHLNAREIGMGYGCLRLNRLKQKVSSIGEEIIRLRDIDTPASTIQQLSLAQQGFSKTIIHYTRVIGRSSSTVSWVGLDGSHGSCEYGKNGVKRVEEHIHHFATDTRTYRESTLTHDYQVRETRQRYTHTENNEQKFN